MTAAEQYAQWGAAVECESGQVVLQVGKEITTLTPKQAQRFAFYLARAYSDAAYLTRRSNQLVIGGARR